MQTRPNLPYKSVTAISMVDGGVWRRLWGGKSSENAMQEVVGDG